MKTIKSITTSSYIVSLDQASNGNYYIGMVKEGKPAMISNPIETLDLALTTFDFAKAEVDGTLH